MDASVVFRPLCTKHIAVWPRRFWLVSPNRMLHVKEFLHFIFSYSPHVSRCESSASNFILQSMLVWRIYCLKLVALYVQLTWLTKLEILRRSQRRWGWYNFCFSFSAFGKRSGQNIIDMMSFRHGCCSVHGLGNPWSLAPLHLSDDSYGSSTLSSGVTIHFHGWRSPWFLC